MTVITAPTLETVLAVVNQNLGFCQASHHAASLRTTTSITRPMSVLVVLPLALSALSKLYALRVSVATFW